MTNAQWYWDKGEFDRRFAQAGGNLSELARKTGVVRPTLQHWQRKHATAHLHPAKSPTPAPSTPGVDVTGDTATITLPPGTPWQPDQILRENGFDPQEWIVTNARPNTWQMWAGENGIVDLHQLKVEAKRRIPADMWLPARTDAPVRSVKHAKKAKTQPSLVALVGDQHCPHQDPGLESCWLAWCEANTPDRIVGTGDIVNLAKPSRHRPNLHDKHNDSPNECFHEGHAWWRRTIDAAGGECEADQLPGNHDLRAQIACMEKLPDLYDCTRPGEEHPWWDLEYMLGLDKLGVQYHRPEGEYHAATLVVAPGITVTHGAKSGPYGGAAKDAARHEGSRVTGHDHKQAITHVVRYRDGEPHRHVLVSAGTMARRDLGYAVDPDAHQGFATLTIHPDGYWNVELARYDDRRGRLVWRDQVYFAAE